MTRRSVFHLVAVTCILFAAVPANAIHTDVFPDKQPLVLNKADAPTYEKARADLTAAIEEFRTLAKQAEKDLSPSVTKALKKSLATIRANAGVIHSLSKAAENKPGMAIADKLIINDDILGKQASINATAKLLDDLNSKFGLLEPVTLR